MEMKEFGKRLRLLRRNEMPTMDRWPIEDVAGFAMCDYKLKMGYTFDLNHPVLFTEKIQWYRLFYECKDFGRIVDKIRFKDYIREKLGDGYTIPLIQVFHNIEELKGKWESLPKSFCLKANLQGDGRYIKPITDKSSINLDELLSEVKDWFLVRNTLKNTAACKIYNSEPLVFAEQFMSNFKDQLYDYKFFCFDGEPFCMYVATEHFEDEKYPITFYDLDWNKMDVQYGGHKNTDAPKPRHYKDMLQIAKKLNS